MNIWNENIKLSPDKKTKTPNDKNIIHTKHDWAFNLQVLAVAVGGRPEGCYSNITNNQDGA